jgi:hypothetical protein
MQSLIYASPCHTSHQHQDQLSRDLHSMWRSSITTIGEFTGPITQVTRQMIESAEARHFAVA